MTRELNNSGEKVALKPDYERDGIVMYQADCMSLGPAIAAESVDLILTDPPYGIDYQSARRIDKSTIKPKIANDTKPFIWWLRDAARILKPTGCLLCFCRWDVQEAFRAAIDWAGFDVGAQIIWDRVGHGMGDLEGTPAPQHDVIWFATKGGFKFQGRRPKSVIQSQRLSSEALSHPNEKPLDLMLQLVRAYSGEGDTVADFFIGSGVVADACCRLKRRFIGSELDSNYFHAATQRIEKAFEDQGLFMGNH